MSVVIFRLIIRCLPGKVVDRDVDVIKLNDLNLYSQPMWFDLNYITNGYFRTKLYSRLNNKIQKKMEFILYITKISFRIVFKFLYLIISIIWLIIRFIIKILINTKIRFLVMNLIIMFYLILAWGLTSLVLPTFWR